MLDYIQIISSRYKQVMSPFLLKSLILLWVCHFCVDFFTGFWPIYKHIAGVDIALAGLLAGLSGFIGEFFQLFFGYFSDRGYRKKILLLGILLSSMVLWITKLTHPLQYFFLLLLLMIGSSAFHPAAAGLAGSLSGDKKGFSILLFSSGGAVGLGISQIVFSKCLAYHEFPFILCFSVLILLIFVALYPFHDASPRQTLPLRSFLKPLINKGRPLTFLYLSQVANYTLVTSFVFLLPELMQSKGCSSWLCLGGGHLCFILGSAVMMIPAGYLCDRYGQKNVLAAILPLSLLLLYGFLFAREISTAISICSLLVLGGLMMTINPIIVSWGNRLVPESPSTVSSLLMGCAWCLGNLGPIWAGLLVQSFEVDPVVSSLFYLGSLLGLALIFALAAPHITKETTAEDPVSELAVTEVLTSENTEKKES